MFEQKNKKAAVAVAVAVLAVWAPHLTQAALAPSPVLTVVAPAASGSVSGPAYLMEGASSQALKDAKFIIWQGTANVSSCPGTIDSTGFNVSCPWNSTALANGSYQVELSGVSTGGFSGSSGLIPFKVTNQTAPAPPTVTLLNPTASAVVGGVFTFRAQTDKAAEGLQFHVTTTAPVTVPPCSATSADSLVWTCPWDSAAVPDGTYAVTAQALAGGVSVSKSAQVSFGVKNQAAASVALITPAASSVLDSKPIVLSAKASGPAGHKVQFRVQAYGAALADAAVFEAFGSPYGDTWTANWPSPDSAGAKYQVTAIVKGPDGTTNLATDGPRVFTYQPVILTYVTLSAPTAGTSFTAMPIAFSANATGPAGSNVRFRIQTSGAAPTGPIITELKGTAANTVWTATWNSSSQANGTYQVTAVLMDAAGATQLASDGPVSFSYQSSSPDAATVSMVVPPAAGVLTTAPINFGATATGPAGFTVKFRVQKQGAVEADPAAFEAAATLSSQVWKAAWTNPTVGQYQATASVYDAAGQAKLATSALRLFSYQPVTASVAITNPVAASVTSNASINLAANAAGVTSVKFLVYAAGGVAAQAQPIATVVGVNASGQAWSATWTLAADAPSADYEVVAKGFNGDVAAASDGPRTFRYERAASGAVTVAIKTPSFGATIAAAPISFTASASGTGFKTIKFKVLPAGQPATGTPTAVITAALVGDVWSGSWTPAAGTVGSFDLYVVAADSLDKQLSIDGPRGFKYSPPAAVSVAIITPTADATISTANVPVSAKVSGAGATEVVFRVFPAGAPITGTPKAEFSGVLAEQVWSGSWAPAPGTTGKFDLYAVAYDVADKQLASAGPRPFSFTPSTTTPQVTLAISAPTTGAVMSAVPIGFGAKTSGTGVVRVVFRVYPRGGSAGAQPQQPLFTGFGELATGIWKATWTPPTETSKADFDLTAQALDADNMVLAEAGPRTFTFEPIVVAPAPLQVVMTMPASGSALQQTVNISATTGRKADKVSFIVKAISLPVPLTMLGTSDESGIIWSAVWDTQTVANGDYYIRAEAKAGTITALSSEVSVAVKNDKALAAETFVVRLVNPTSGAVLKGLADLKASVDRRPGQINFVLEPANAPAGTAPFVVRGISDSTGLGWSAQFDTTSLPNGAYRVRVKASTNGQPAGESAAIDVTLQNAQTTSPGGATTGPVPAPGTLEPTPPSVAGSVALAVKVTDVPSSGSGLIVLGAAVIGKADSVVFQVKATDGGAAVVKTAVFAPELGLWSALWDTTAGPDGKYGIVATAAASTVRATSLPFYLTVANATAAPSPEPAPVPGEPATPPEQPIAATVPLTDMKFIPPEVLRQAVQEVPAGTKMLDTVPMTDQVVAAEQRLDATCTANGIGPDRCQQWLAFRQRNDECRQAGIITREECAAYLLSKHPEISAEEVALSTAGLMPKEELGRLSDAMTPLIGTTLRFRRPEAVPPTAVGETPPVNAATEPTGEQKLESPPPTEPVNEIVAENIPLKADQEISFKVQASPAAVRTDATSSHQAVPAVLLIDSDGDGLPDDVEKRWGTDPFKADTDGDGFSDGAEVKNGYNPLGPGRLRDAGLSIAPIDAAIVSGAPLEQPHDTGTVSPDLKVSAAEAAPAGQAPGTSARTTFRGRSRPGETVTIYVYSYLPLVLTTTADANGNWQYDLSDSLTDGEHTAYVAVTDETGKIQAKSDPLPFFVAEAKAVTEEDFFKPTSMVNVEAPVNDMLRWYMLGAIGLVAVGLLVGLFIVLGRGRASGGSPE